jgi:microcystin degradation protein MlrC
MTRRRALIGAFKEESNTFVPFRAAKRDFTGGIYYAQGEQVLTAFAGRKLEVAGFMDALQAAGWEIIPSIAAEAVPSGPVEAETFSWFMDQFRQAIAGAGRLDAVLLGLHGAMIAESSDDADGDLLTSVRQWAGPQAFIGATLDLHAKITPRMVQAADMLFGFHTYPHVDQYKVALHVGRLATEWAGRQERPALAMCKVPMLISPARQATAAGPFADLMGEAIALEREPGILGVSLFPVQPWLDIPRLGFTVLVATAGDAARAQREADRLGRLVWAKRHEFDLDAPKADEAVRQALAVEGGPVVIADLGDGPGGGAGGDSTALLRAMLAQHAGAAGPALLTLTDPEAVPAAQAAGVGGRLTVTLGGKLSAGFYEPIQVAGVVTYLGTPSYSAYKGETSMGPTTVLDVDGVFIVLTQKPVLSVTPSPFEAVGLDPRRCKMVVAKSGSQFREEFEPFARAIIYANTPGPCSSDFPSLPYRRLTRPMYPWEDWDWQP